MLLDQNFYSDQIKYKSNVPVTKLKDEEKIYQTIQDHTFRFPKALTWAIMLIISLIFFFYKEI